MRESCRVLCNGLRKFCNSGQAACFGDAKNRRPAGWRVGCQKSPPQEFLPKAKINSDHFFGGVYVREAPHGGAFSAKPRKAWPTEKALCGPNSARSPFSKKWHSHFFDTQTAARWGGGLYGGGDLSWYGRVPRFMCPASPPGASRPRRTGRRPPDKSRPPSPTCHRPVRRTGIWRWQES